MTVATVERRIARTREFVFDAAVEAVARVELPGGTDVQRLGDDLAAPVPFQTLILHGGVDRSWVDGHVDFRLEHHGARL